MAFVDGDVVAAAKKVVDAAKKFPSLVLEGPIWTARCWTPPRRRRSRRSSRAVMLSKIAGMLKAEMTRAASMFQALQSRFVGLLEAYRDRLPAEAEEASAPGPRRAPSPRARPRSHRETIRRRPKAETTEEG